MNNNLLLKAQQWLTELGIRTEASQTFLKINRLDVLDSCLFGGKTEKEQTANLLSELKLAVGSNKLYFEGDYFDHHLNSF